MYSGCCEELYSSIWCCHSLKKDVIWNTFFKELGTVLVIFGSVLEWLLKIWLEIEMKRLFTQKYTKTKNL